MVARGTVWGALATASLAIAGWYAALGLSIAGHVTSLPWMMALLLLLAVACRGAVRTGRGQRLVDAVEAIGLFGWTGLLGALASYAAAVGDHGFADAALARADAALGFDWTAAYRLHAAGTWLTPAARLAYCSIFTTPPAVLLALALTGRMERALRLIALFGLTLCVGIAIFHVWPVRSALAYHIGLAPAYLPVTGTGPATAIDGLRAGTLTVIDPGRLEGLIDMPSFHAVSAILFTWAGWPLRRLRAPLVVVNGAMLLATPVEGAHYLVDVIAGVVLALAAIGAARAYRRPARAAVAAAPPLATA